LLTLDAGYNAEFSNWNPDGNECTCTFTCFDDYPDPRFRHNKDELFEWVIKRFGAMILEDKRKPRHMDLSAAARGMPLRHPLIKKDKRDNPSMADSFREEYILEMTKKQLEEANSTLVHSTRLIADKVKPTSSYASDIYQLRMGIW
jgi:hypothetical protein